MPRITPVPLSSLVVALAACGGGGGGAPPDAAAPHDAPAAPQDAPAAAALLPVEKTCGLANFEQDLLARINGARAGARNCGGTAYPAAAALDWNDQLFDAAAAHALDMAGHNYFSHVSRDGRSFSQRIDAAGYAWAAAGENIAAGQASTEQVVAEWLASPGHCANIMTAGFTDVSVSCVRDEHSDYRYYWAMELGHPR